MIFRFVVRVVLFYVKQTSVMLAPRRKSITYRTGSDNAAQLFLLSFPLLTFLVDADILSQQLSYVSPSPSYTQPM